MKKTSLLALFVSTLFAACSNSVENMTDEGATATKMKSSELLIFSGGQQMGQATRANFDPKADVGYNVPDNGRYLVFYYLRIDNNIPGEEEVNLPADAYFPRTKAGKTMVSDLNHGYVEANVEWRSCKGFSKYIYSTDGSAVQSIIVEEPTIEDLVKANEGPGDDFSGYIKNKDKLHFLWYTCKKQDTDHAWHIDGILTSKDRTDISETKYGKDIMDNYESKGMTADEGSVVRKGHVEVDVHQQEHKDWNEIKTSIHLRDTVTTEVFIPIEYAELADDFDIRVGKDYEYVTEVLKSKVTIAGKEYSLGVSITHKEDGIHIILTPDKEALKAAREVYDDGITYEIHSYVSTEIPQDVIWEKLRKTKVTVSPYTTLTGQITSAFYDNRVEL